MERLKESEEVGENWKLCTSDSLPPFVRCVLIDLLLRRTSRAISTVTIELRVLSHVPLASSWTWADGTSHVLPTNPRAICSVNEILLANKTR
jgi:hypothetical protein